MRFSDWESVLSGHMPEAARLASAHSGRQFGRSFPLFLNGTGIASMPVSPCYRYRGKNRFPLKEGVPMKILQVVPKPGTKARLKTLLKNTERHLRGGNTTFHRMREGRWKHVKYPGWIQWGDAPGNLLLAEIQTKARDHEWQMLHAFIGYLDRHLGDKIDTIAIYYR
jgi:hypothetical protein